MRNVPVLMTPKNYAIRIHGTQENGTAGPFQISTNDSAYYDLLLDAGQYHCNLEKAIQALKDFGELHKLPLFADMDAYHKEYALRTNK